MDRILEIKRNYRRVDVNYIEINDKRGGDVFCRQSRGDSKSKNSLSVELVFNTKLRNSDVGLLRSLLITSIDRRSSDPKCCKKKSHSRRILVQFRERLFHKYYYRLLNTISTPINSVLRWKKYTPNAIKCFSSLSNIMLVSKRPWSVTEKATSHKSKLRKSGLNRSSHAAENKISAIIENPRRKEDKRYGGHTKKFSSFEGLGNKDNFSCFDKGINRTRRICKGFMSTLISAFMISSMMVAASDINRPSLPNSSIPHRKDRSTLSMYANEPKQETASNEFIAARFSRRETLKQLQGTMNLTQSPMRRGLVDISALDLTTLLPSLLRTTPPTLSPYHSSLSPTSLPSLSPSFHPSLSPSFHPSLSPSSHPSSSPSSLPSMLPTLSPSFLPSSLPTPVPSAVPSFEPSTIPTLSLEPSAIPTLTMIPSTIPTLSSYPTSPPTGNPSSRPSASPSILPTHQEPSVKTSKHELMFVGIGLEEMNPDLIETVMENIEDLKFGRNDNGVSIGFIDDVPPGFVDVNATFIEQTRKKGDNNEFSVGLTFNMKFSSRKVDVEGYLDKFIDTMKSDEGKNVLHVTLERDGYIPKGSQNIKIVLYYFEDLTSTPVPIAVPTNPMPTASPTSKNSLVQNTIVSAGIAGIAIFLLLVLYFLNPFYKKRKQRSEERNIEMVISVGDRSYMSDGVSSGIFYSASNSSAGFSRDGYPPSEGVHEPEELLSVGHSDHSDSNSDRDERNVLVDEFEEFQNPSLEKMRTQVEENVVNSGGMMSEAITREFLKEYDSEEEDDDLKKIFHGNAIEIEAGVLCETNDWLKRKQGASIEDR